MWTEETIATLTRLVREGLKSAEVARIMGISRNMAIGKVRRLGLTWAAQSWGGKGLSDFTPEQRAEILADLRGGQPPSMVADRRHVSYDRVKRLMAEEGMPIPSQGRPAGRRGRAVGRPAPLPPLRTKEPPMVVPDRRQTAMRVVEGPPVRASNVVTLAVSSRECSWTDGERGAWVHCCERRVKGPFCAEHALRGFARRAVEEVA